MLTAAQIRQSFLDFFKSKQHTIVQSSSLMPDSPNLLFTNAGMNQFVPIFLGQIECPYKPGRAADTQKCIRAGGKHNDLDDVGLDTYHHTFFEMLGNWSFGDYFKKEAISWSWELIVERFKFPPNRVYATIYQPDKSLGDPSERDQEAWDLWAEKFRSVGLDPEVHIVNGNKKDNFWMMGETGPCGPCSEVHIDLTPAGDTKGKLVNVGTAECIEIWNNVFIQFNANPDGTFTPLPAQHVDTGMGFERLVSIIQCTKNFTDFANAKVSNYETDVFRPIFDEIEKMSGKQYGSTLPQPNAQGQVIPTTEQEKIDVAFRVIADHIRTLSFSIADGIQPGNTDRNYVLRRILRRAVRYGRSLGFKEPFFYKLVDVLAAHMGNVFPEIRTRHQIVKDVLKREEEAFNRTLDKGIALFENESTRLTETGEHARPRVFGEDAPSSTERPQTPATTKTRSDRPQHTATYTRRNLPHFERPWAKYFITFSTAVRRELSPEERDIVMETILHDSGKTFTLYAACAMPDHVHILIEPSVKERDAAGNADFYSLSEIMQTIKSVSAHKINKAAGSKGSIWDKESFDRMVRGDSDLEEKFYYIVENPWRNGLESAADEGTYKWVWTPEWTRSKMLVQPADVQSRAGRPLQAREGARTPLTASDHTNEARRAHAPRVFGEDAPSSTERPQTPTISAAFAFRLYDEQGFPLDLTELMARERGLSVDVAGFNTLMEEQRNRARAAQKKQIIALSEIETKEPTKFIGYDALTANAKVLEVVSMKDKTAVILDVSTAYAEMGGQVGDSGLISHGADVWTVVNTQKSGNTWLHFLDPETSNLEPAPEPGKTVQFSVDKLRRSAIERHHTVTHLMHWALHEVVSREASQKGSFVGPDKLTFDFNSAALTPQQVRDIEKLVNERIVENGSVSWQEIPYADIKSRADIMQFFGDKYGDTVRVVQIGGKAHALDGYSMELCGGTHTRGTGEIGLFRIVAEGAVAAGVRRIEAIAGLEAYNAARTESDLLKVLASKVMAQGAADLEKKLDALLSHQKELEKSLKAAQQREASGRAKDLLATASNNAIIANLGAVDGDYVMAVNDALKGLFRGIIVLGSALNGAVVLTANVDKDFQAKAQAGKIIQTIAPIVGGKGGGKPDFARGGGKDADKLDVALNEARKLLGQHG